MHVRMWFETMISWSSIRLICVTLKPPFSDSKWKEQVKTTLPHRTVCANNRLKVYFRFSSSGCNNLTVRVANILSSSQPSLNSTPALPANITSVIHYTPWALALGIGMLHFPHHYQPFWKCKQILIFFSTENSYSSLRGFIGLKQVKEKKGLYFTLVPQTSYLANKPGGAQILLLSAQQCSILCIFKAPYSYTESRNLKVTH